MESITNLRKALYEKRGARKDEGGSKNDVEEINNSGRLNKFKKIIMEEKS